MSLLEEERSLLVGQLPVDSGEGLGLGLDIGLVLAVQVDLEDSLSVGLDPCSLSYNFSRVADIVQDSILDLGEGTRTRARSLGLCASVVGLSQNGALGNDQNMASREFLFQLSDQSSVDFLEGAQQLVGNVQDDGLLATAGIDLLGSGNIKVPQRSLELGRGHLQVEKLLGHGGFELIGFLRGKGRGEN
jgi:hypothetical protein